MPFGYLIYGMIASRGVPSLGDWINYATFFIGPAVNILFGRVLLEVALVVLDLKPEWRRPRIT